ncbi:MAG: hypothetical protein IH984_00790 [Planctomycetes bacterium]|nr:hypothetical protein [Planctomycetota bacterium]
MFASIRQSFHATFQVMALCAILWGIGYGITTSHFTFQYYRLWRFPNSEGHHLAETLARAQTTRGDICLLIGPSTVREAFDEEIMQQTAPDLRFLNGGTTGGGIYVFEAMNHLIHQSGVNPKCIVVGLNARMLIARDIRLHSAGYTDFLDLFNGSQILSKESIALQDEARQQIVSNTIWPYRRLARHTSRLIRTAIFVAQEKLSWNESLPVTAFSYGHRELGRSSMHLHNDTEPISGEAWDRLMRIYKEKGFFDPARYAHAEHLDSLRGVLDDLFEITQHLIIIQMPENSFGREHLAPLASDAMEILLADYQERGAHILDLTSEVPDSGMRDVGHILASSRPDFSRKVAQFISDCINGNEGAWHERTASYSD